MFQKSLGFLFSVYFELISMKSILKNDFVIPNDIMFFGYFIHLIKTKTKTKNILFTLYSQYEYLFKQLHEFQYWNSSLKSQQ